MMIMRNFRVAGPLLLLLAAAGCRRPSTAEFDAFTQSFVYSSLALSPVSATSVAYAQHGGRSLDDLWDDYSPAGLEAQRAHWKNSRETLLKLRPEDLDLARRADANLIENTIALAEFELNEAESWQRSPALYVELIGNGLFNLYAVETAPLEKRYRHIIARLKGLPEFCRQAASNLKCAPPVWRRVAVEENEGNLGLVEITLKEGVPETLQDAYDKAAVPAAAALRQLSQAIAKLPSPPEGDEGYRLGPEKYARKFGLVMPSGSSPQMVLKGAEDAVRRIRREMFDIALVLHKEYFPDHRDPVDLNLIVGEVLDVIARQHAPRAGFFAAAAQTLAEARSFVAEREIVKLPGRDNLRLIETPPFMRGIYGVGGFNPAPALQPSRQAFYWLTPIPEEWPDDRAESKLREYNDYGLRLLTIHEAIPGHYVQAEYASRIQPEPRRLLRTLFGSQVYVEGWAMYATDQVMEAGFLDRRPEMRLTWLKQLLRAVGNTVLDIRTHTGGMKEAEALEFMTRQTFQEVEEARAKWQRAQLSSCQLPTYWVGYEAWKRLRALSRYAGPEFHRRALSLGALPPDVTFEKLLEAAPPPAVP